MALELIFASVLATVLPPALPCDIKPGFGDKYEASCQLPASSTPQPLRFTAQFSGGHDDTRAQMELTLGGAPLACGEGSKLELEGEYGDVSLVCRFTLEPGDTRQLSAAVKWYHAENTGATLTPDKKP
jgi:hypothetical protein